MNKFTVSKLVHEAEDKTKHGNKMSAAESLHYMYYVFIIIIFFSLNFLPLLDLCVFHVVFCSRV